MNEMRKLVGWYASGLRGAAQLRGQINQVDDPNIVKEMLLAFAQEAVLST